MIIDPVKTELAIREAIDTMRTLRDNRFNEAAKIEEQLQMLKRQHEIQMLEINRLTEEINKWSSHLAPDQPETEVKRVSSSSTVPTVDVVDSASKPGAK